MHETYHQPCKFYPRLQIALHRSSDVYCIAVRASQEVFDGPGMHLRMQRRSHDAKSQRVLMI